MKLYKFRSLSSWEFFLDIVLNNRLYCAHYEELNDPFEGVFRAKNEEITNCAGVKLLNDESGSRRVDDIFPFNKEKRLCSLSSEKAFRDIRMWSHYAAGHQGVAIEFEFDDEEEWLQKVEYFEWLPSVEFRDDGLVELSYIYRGEVPKDSGSQGKRVRTNLLNFKTNHWSYEEEYRIVSNSQYFSVEGQIKAVHVGDRCSAENLNLLRKIVPSHLDIYLAKLDTKRLVVEKGRAPIGFSESLSLNGDGC